MATNYLNLSLKRRHYYSAENIRIYGTPAPTLTERYKHARECAQGDADKRRLYEAVSLRRHIMDLQKAYPSYSDKFTNMLQKMPDEIARLVPISK